MKYINKTNDTVAFGRFRMEPGSMLVDPSFTSAELSVVSFYISKGILSKEDETVVKSQVKPVKQNKPDEKQEEKQADK